MDLPRLQLRENPTTGWTIYNSGSTPSLVALPQRDSDLSAQKILVVDDDPDLRLGLGIRLRSNNYDVYFADGATSALQSARKHLPDLIILDLGLPDEDGYFVMRALQQSAELARIPVIVLSGWNRYSHELLTRLVGARKFFQKPVDDRILLQHIQHLLK